MRSAAPACDTLSQPALDFAFDPTYSSRGEVNPLRKAILGLQLIDKRGAKTRGLADLLDSQDLDGGKRGR